MASAVSICNRALQFLGDTRITSLTEDTRNARACNAAYDLALEQELTKYFWKFAMTREVLAPDATAPAFDFTYQFTLPAKCLRVVKPNRVGLDWKFEGTKILTNEGNILQINYVQKVEDPNLFSPLFADALAARIALDIADEITQSSTRIQIAKDRYKEAVKEARRCDAFWAAEREPVMDDWLALTR